MLRGYETGEESLGELYAYAEVVVVGEGDLEGSFESFAEGLVQVVDEDGVAKAAGEDVFVGGCVLT